jgi:cytochrome c biogenesis protein
MNAIKSSNGDERSSPHKSAVDFILDFLGSLGFTIFLLSAIAVGSVFGTLLKQKAGVGEYLSVYSESTYRIIKFFGLDDAYHSLWFYALLILFAANLLLCTLKRFIPLMNAGRAVKLPGEDALSKMAMHFRLEETDSGKIKNLLHRKGYRCLYTANEGEVFGKGGIAQYGVLLIHTSIIIILLGGLIGLIFGYRGFMVLNKGESKDQVELRAEKPTTLPLGFSLKCLDFKVSFYPGGEPKDYVSTVEVIDQNRVVMERQIRVNSPLSYKGIHIYQASYGMTPLFHFTIGGEDVTLRQGDTYKKNGLVMMMAKYAASVHNFGPGVLVAYLNNGEPKTLWFLKNVDRLKSHTLQGIQVRLADIVEEPYTGLQVTKDPGTWVVWTGFAMILFGMYVNFFLYSRRVFVRKASSGIIIAGQAHRNREIFREEFERLKEKIHEPSP